MPNTKRAKVSEPAATTVPFSLVPALAQQKMYQALVALIAGNAAADSGSEVAEIAITLALDERDPVILASPGRGARIVRKRCKTLAATHSSGKLAAATLAAVEKLLADSQATALVCAGRLDAQPGTHEDYRRAFQFAARHKLPILFLVANSFTPGRRQELDLRTLYAEFGIPVFSVDANDAIAAYRVTTEALHNARHHRGPCVIEALSVLGKRGSASPLCLLQDYMERHGNSPKS